MAKPTMSDYVAETAKVVRRPISQHPEKPLVEAFLSNPRHVIRIIACGSSRNAAELSRPYLRHILGREVLVTEPRAFCEYEHQLVAREFCVVISQSGYSTNALDALRCLRDLGEAPLGITGDVASDFSQLADPLIDYGVGEELVGYVTKGVTSLTTFLALFGIGVAEREGRLSEAEASREREDIESLMEGFEETRVATPLLLERRYKELLRLRTQLWACSRGCPQVCGMLANSCLRPGIGGVPPRPQSPNQSPLYAIPSRPGATELE